MTPDWPKPFSRFKRIRLLAGPVLTHPFLPMWPIAALPVSRCHCMGSTTLTRPCSPNRTIASRSLSLLPAGAASCTASARSLRPFPAHCTWLFAWLRIGSIRPRIAQRDGCSVPLDQRSACGSKPDAPPARASRKKSTAREKGGRAQEVRTSQETRRTRLHTEKRAFPWRENPSGIKTRGSRRHTERSGQAFRDPTPADRHVPRGGNARLTSQPLPAWERRACAR